MLNPEIFNTKVLTFELVTLVLQRSRSMLDFVNLQINLIFILYLYPGL